MESVVYIFYQAATSRKKIPKYIEQFWILLLLHLII